MSVDKAVKYDYHGCLMFLIGLQTICGLLAGFAFTGTIVVLTSLGDPSAFFSQLSLVILYAAMLIFLSALFEIHFLSITICVQSPSAVIPVCPTRWVSINRYMFVGSFLVTVSLPVMFLLKSLVLLFALSMCYAVVGNVVFYLYRWVPVRKEMEAKGIV